MTKALIPLLLIFLSTEVHAQFTKADFDHFHMVEGRWESSIKKGRYIEQWSRLNDSVYTSRSYLLTGTDSLPQEEVELRFSNNSIVYAPIVYEQNEGKRVYFPLVSITRKEDGSILFLFENKAHDFPQQISYHPSAQALEVITSGISKGQKREIPFRFKKLL